MVSKAFLKSMKPMHSGSFHSVLCCSSWVARQHGLEGLSARQSYNQARNQVRKRTRQLRKQYGLNIANQSTSNLKVFWRFARERLKTRIGVAPLLCNHDDPGTLRRSDE